MPTKRWMTVLAIGVFALAFLATGCGGGGSYVAPPPPPPVPAISLMPASLTFPAVQGGSNPASQTFTVTNFGSVGSTLNYTVTKTQTWLALSGSSGSLAAGKTDTISVSLNISGLVANTYTDTITVSATGATNTPQTLAVTLIVTAPPKPVIGSVTPQTIFSPREGSTIVDLLGTGIGCVGGTLNVGTDTIPLTTDNVVSSGEIKLGFSFGQKYFHPDWMEFSVTCPASASASGTSNEVSAAFVGNLSTGARSSTQIFLNDQANGMFRVYDIATGQKTLDISNGSVLTYGLAVDDKTGYVVYTKSNGVIFLKPDGTVVGGSDTGAVPLPLAPSAKGGYACVSRDTANLVISMDLSETIPPPIPDAVDGTPWNTAMTNLGGNQLACVVYGADSTVLSVVKVPQMTLWNSTALVGLTPMSKLTVPPDGGWQMAVLEASASVKIVAVLSQYDKKLVFTKIATDSTGNLLTLTDMGTIALSGAPIRIAADSTNQSFVVAFADTTNSVSVFAKIDPTKIDAVTGNIVVAPLQTTTALLASYVDVSDDGTNIYIGGRDPNTKEMVLQILPNQ